MRALFIRWNIGFKVMIAGAAFIGVAMQLFKYGGYMLRYYTVQSNLLVGFFMLYLLYQYARQGHWTKGQMRLKGGLTMAIVLTGAVYHIMLRPQKTSEEFWTVENFLVHYIVPWGTLLDCLVFDKAKCYRWSDPFWWTLVPIAYAISAVWIGVTLRLPIEDNADSPFPYFFLNVDKYGYGGIFKYVIALALGFFLFSYLLVCSKQLFSMKKKAK
ncbi:Pr6Pr family membrane protein [Aerococcaceae bacterium zg-B36]|uniref:Pr6Pr family membrane protein n=1 Tax=Aerococcaceae bacterium zg-252 TaxID=2796928 RepID=UPI001BD8FC60|nr:Pr6Pr family membrane protein [Aerococcaceae bacterium zg-B36]